MYDQLPYVALFLLSMLHQSEMRLLIFALAREPQRKPSEANSFQFGDILPVLRFEHASNFSD